MDIIATNRASLWLKIALSERQSRNPHYSLRAFARDLKLSPAHLVNVMAGRRELTLQLAEKVSNQMNLDPQQKDQLFKCAANRSLGQSPAKQKSKVFETLEMDKFAVVADEHFAILGLTHIPGAKYDSDWIAARLGIPTHKAQKALARLEELKLIERHGHTMRQSGLPLDTTHDVPSTAIRKHHLDHLRLAELSLVRDPIEARYFGALTMAVDKSDMEKAKKMIRTFRNKFLKTFGNKPSADSVYSLMTNFYTLEQQK